MERKDKIRCDYLIITDGKYITQTSAHLINDTLHTLTSQPKVLIRNINDQGKQKDKIECKKVLFLFLARISFFKLLLNWLNALPGITNRDEQVLVLIQVHDTEIGDRSDIDRVISEINKEKEFAMMKWITSFNDITSWWSIIIKFLFKVKSLRSTDVITYKLVFAIHEMKNSKIAGILSHTLSSFKLKESDASELYIIRVTNTTQREDMTDTHTGINIYYKSDSCALSTAMLTVLIDLKVIKAKQTKQITRAIRTKTKQSNRVLTCLLNILYSFLFVLTSLLNLPFIAIHVPFTYCLNWLSPLFGLFFIVMMSKNGKSRWHLIIVHNITVFIMFCILAGVLSLFYSWLSVLIGIYAIVWPIILHDLLCKIGFDYGVVSLPLAVWGKIDFGLVRILYRHFGTIRKQTCVRKLKPILKGLFKLMHFPFFILYGFLFLIVIIPSDELKGEFLFFSVFYTNFALSLGFGIAGGILLLSKISFVAIICIVISLYIFFFLCVLHTYCWLEHDLVFGILSTLKRRHMTQ